VILTQSGRWCEDKWRRARNELHGVLSMVGGVRIKRWLRTWLDIFLKIGLSGTMLVRSDWTMLGSILFQRMTTKC